jgi:hypothetical protein
MKQTEKITGLMNGKVKFDKKSLSFLSDTIREKPWFQTAQLLYTLNLLNLKDAHFLFELRKTSALVSDRQKLFFLVEDKFFDPRLMELLEKEPDSYLDAFGKIDSFLGDTPAEEQPESLVSTDYLAYLNLENENQEETNDNPLKHQETINKFLEQDKNFPVRLELKEEDKEFPNVNYNITDNYEFDDSELFSETLAKIYLKQQKFDKALEIFHKLNLEYPEKSSYFAARIETLEELRNNNLNKTE